MKMRYVLFFMAMILVGFVLVSVVSQAQQPKPAPLPDGWSYATVRSVEAETVKGNVTLHIDITYSAPCSGSIVIQSGDFRKGSRIDVYVIIRPLEGDCFRVVRSTTDLVLGRLPSGDYRLRINEQSFGKFQVK